MKLVLVVALVLSLFAAAASASPLSEEQMQFLFTKWIDQHNKTYESPKIFFQRFQIWKSNFDYVHNHNANPARTFDLGMNKFADLSNDEFKAIYNGYRPRVRDFSRRKNEVSTVSSSVPSSVDWRTKGVLTPVKDQGQCGSCWSFSATGSIEAAHAIATGNLISLSEQELVDCSGPEGNEGCNGGLMDQAFEFVIQNHGLCTESAYPYEAQDDTCRESKCTSAFTISGYKDVSQNNEDALQTAVASQPVSVAVDASGLNWQLYSGGVMSGSCGTDLDHGVLAAGYGSSGSQLYWIVKNSWGSSWGEGGYLRMLRATGSGSPGFCGIAMDPSFPTA